MRYLLIGVASVLAVIVGPVRAQASNEFISRRLNSEKAIVEGVFQNYPTLATEVLSSDTDTWA